MTVRLCIDDAIGEHRRALVDADGKVFRLEIERWSERGRRARLDEVWWGRVKGRMPGGRGWFVDLGLEQDGVVEPSKAQAIVEGALLPLRVKSEAHAEKGAVLSLADMSPAEARPQQAQLRSSPKADPFLHGARIDGRIEGAPARTIIDAAIEEAGQRIAPLPGGGDLAIETVRALTAIDVDAGDRTGLGDAEAFSLELNLAAANEAARQISMRALGGLVVIDFVGMRRLKSRQSVADRLRDELAVRLGRASRILGISELGLCEVAIARRQRPLSDALACSKEEREALDALRLIESAGRTSRGGKIFARISRAAHAWLEADTIGWPRALAERIGARWTFDIEDRSPGRPKVWSAS